jgi:hypothetical protein
MAYKVFNNGKGKPKMNNASSMKTNAAMYASKTSMYGKPMMDDGDEPRKPTKLEQLDVMEGMQKRANAPGRRKAERDVNDKSMDLRGEEQNLTGEFLADLENRKKGFYKEAAKVGNIAGGEFVSNQESGKQWLKMKSLEGTAKNVAEEKIKEVAKKAGGSASDFPVLTEELAKESYGYARSAAGRIKQAKKKQATRTKPSMYGKKKKK